MTDEDKGGPLTLEHAIRRIEGMKATIHKVVAERDKSWAEAERLTAEVESYQVADAHLYAAGLKAGREQAAVIAEGYAHHPIAAAIRKGIKA